MNEGIDQVREGDPPASPPPAEKNPYDISWIWFFRALFFLIVVCPLCVILFGFITDTNPQIRKWILMMFLFG